MPELPEVEVICRGLRAVLPGRVITEIDVLNQGSFFEYEKLSAGVLVGSEIKAISRRGKLIIIDLLDEQASAWCLLIHLRMTGQLIFRNLDTDGAPANSKPADSGFAGGWPAQSLIGEMPDKSTRLIVEFSDGSHLYFNDQRKFGYFKLVPAEQLEHEDFLVRLGPEPLDADFDWRLLRKRLQPDSQRLYKRSIKAALLDQETIAGVGNIYADESLFMARINPQRNVSSLTVPELKRLCSALRERLTCSIDAGGSTARNYVDAMGLRGEYLDRHAQVYNRAGLQCLRCGSELIKTRVAGRGTVICPKCQK